MKIGSGEAFKHLFGVQPTDECDCGHATWLGPDPGDVEGLPSGFRHPIMPSDAPPVRIVPLGPRHNDGDISRYIHLARGSYHNPYKPQTWDEAHALPPGAHFYDASGVLRIRH